MATRVTPTSRKHGFTLGLKILGAEDARETIKKMDPKARKALLTAMTDISEDILDTANEEFVPVLTGDLLLSGRVKPHPGRFPSVEIMYGGKAAAYAVVQHEAHFRHPRGGSRKYLHKAWRIHEHTIPGRMAVELRTELRDLRAKKRPTK